MVLAFNKCVAEHKSNISNGKTDSNYSENLTYKFIIAMIFFVIGQWRQRY